MSIVYDGIYFISKVCTIINRHIPPYTVVYDILVYTSICKDIISYFDIYEYMQWYHEISFHILTYTSICNDVVWHHIASYISIFPYDILVYQSILEVSGFQMMDCCLHFFENNKLNSGIHLKGPKQFDFKETDSFYCF